MIYTIEDTLSPGSRTACGYKSGGVCLPIGTLGGLFKQCLREGNNLPVTTNLNRFEEVAATNDQVNQGIMSFIQSRRKPVSVSDYDGEDIEDQSL